MCAAVVLVLSRCPCSVLVRMHLALTLGSDLLKRHDTDDFARITRPPWHGMLFYLTGTSTGLALARVHGRVSLLLAGILEYSVMRIFHRRHIA